jgi:1-deoxy-D-xylulose-5-phosphate reductoisomerase
MKQISILGSTGSVGTGALAVIERHPEQFRVSALGAGRNLKRLREQVRRFKPALVATAEAEDAETLAREFASEGLKVLSGSTGMVEVAARSGADLLVSSMVGAVGLEPTYAALEAGIDVALANKETLVMAGRLMTETARRTGAALLPVDSEHAALHQLMEGVRRQDLARVILTASGGPFRRHSAEALERVTAAEALKHPTWTMGEKITIDSATMANKGLEVIEAHWLFGVPPEQVEVVVHPQSIVHGMVELRDGQLLAQLGPTDMKLPIQYAMSYPEKWEPTVTRLRLAELGSLSFEPPDPERFPCLGLAYQALHAGGTAPAVFNAANEVANLAFRQGRIGFGGVSAVIEQTLASERPEAADGLAAVMHADRRARHTAQGLVAGES